MAVPETLLPADAGAIDRGRAVYRPPWRIDVVRRMGLPRVLGDVALARAVAAALEAGRAPAPGSVTVVLTDDAELADLNVEHMGHDGPTDVLSFPMLPPESFAPRPRQTDGRSHARRTAPRMRVGSRTHVGDIAISIERAIDQAGAGRGGQTGDVRWSAADEVRLLATHGTLHLCGWDHAERDDEARMRALEHDLLATAR